MNNPTLVNNTQTRIVNSSFTEFLSPFFAHVPWIYPKSLASSYPPCNSSHHKCMSMSCNKINSSSKPNYLTPLP